MSTAMVAFDEERRVEMTDRWATMQMQAGAYAKIHYTKQDGTLVVDEWHTCRDSYHGCSIGGLRRMLFCHRKKKGANVAAFIESVERKLCLKEPSVCGPTQRNNIMWIRVSPWWNTGAMKRSLFTALLRAAQSYEPEEDNFEEALESNRYTRQTQYAVNRFLNGYTRYTGAMYGWNNQFYWGANLTRPQKPGPDEVNILLQRPLG